MFLVTLYENNVYHVCFCGCRPLTKFGCAFAYITNTQLRNHVVEVCTGAFISYLFQNCSQSKVLA